MAIISPMPDPPPVTRAIFPVITVTVNNEEFHSRIKEAKLTFDIEKVVHTQVVVCNI